MTTTPERAPLNLDPEAVVILEKPTKYPIEVLIETFTPEDVVAVSTYQEELLAEPEKLLLHILPDDFKHTYHASLPLLTYNVSRYSSSFEDSIQTDPVLQSLLTFSNTPERARAICARRSILALTPPKKDKEAE